jgi:hypothetical protein
MAGLPNLGRDLARRLAANKPVYHNKGYVSIRQSERANVIADATIVKLMSLPRQITTAAIARVRDEIARAALVVRWSPAGAEQAFTAAITCAQATRRSTSGGAAHTLCTRRGSIR